MRRLLLSASALGLAAALGCEAEVSEPTVGGSDPVAETAATTSEALRRPAGPCDVLGGAGNTCVAAHSTVRALSAGYSGNLYQVKRADGTTRDIGVLSTGFANAASQDTFCAGTTCTIATIYDQSGNGNHLTPGGPGGNKPTPDNPANATDLKTTGSGHEVYGVLIKPGVGYRKLVGVHTATGDQPETEYMVTSQQNLVNGCCFDYGNAERDAHDDGNGAMEAVNFGGGVVWGTGAPGGHNNGPWVMVDLENGLFAGWQNNQNQDITTNTPLHLNFVTAVVVGDTAAQNGGLGRFALYGGDATTGAVKTMYDGMRPLPGYVPMHKQGGIVLGVAGDNSDTDGGEFFEGVMASGAATVATVNGLQANIVAARYGK